MKIDKYIKKLKKLNACSDALRDALNYETSEPKTKQSQKDPWKMTYQEAVDAEENRLRTEYPVLKGL